MTRINIQDADKAEVLAALFNASQQQGLGLLNPDGAKGMTVEEARECLQRGDDSMFGSPGYFDYLKGRVLKVDLGGTDFNPTLYDRDNGLGAAERALSTIKYVRVDE